MDKIEAVLNYLLQGEHPMELIKLAVTAAIAYFTVTWSLKRFLIEKKWEKKSEAYSRIIEALHHLKCIDALYLEEAYEEMQMNAQSQMSEEKRKEITARYTNAKNELEKYVDMGRYYISDKALTALEKLHKVKAECRSDWNHDAAPIWKIYEKEFEGVKTCLEEIKIIAIKEVHK